MTVHLIKLCVGVDSIDDLARYQERRLKRGEELFHTTRMVPKRADEVVAGGSLYWVIRGQIQLRQRVVEIRPFTDAEGIGRCRLVFDPELVPVRPTPRRAFQGWRYLKPEDAPADLPKGGDMDGLPSEMRAELMELGLI
ncbi:DUF1489 domain-containing protein [Kaustia mangrovi]|uniref:DUF1489 domain-containing protein n=1 Tax=Kaustia mangrovi TaxID=2593653 RepID=A0A7S8HAJ3_9HYPH|nr:DUF1489 domain-containing protein [Kaustia mangrovi]QPC41640.1 DUF1489 domain-containing protein [Kaustia mangrovi]